MYKLTKRRDFLKMSGLLASSLLIPVGLSANENRSDTIIALKDTITNGDPLIIETSLDNIDLSKSLDVKYEVSIDNSFDTIVHHGEYLTKKDEDFNIKIDTKNLDGGTKYYYRFSAYNESSAYWFNETGKIRFI